MELEKIQITNWKKKKFDFKPGKLNYCFHENGYGKTWKAVGSDMSWP